jgi:hypothetical protein
MNKMTVSPFWTPEYIDTELWLDASDTDTITEAAGAVSQWNDKSGNDCHAVQASSISQPITNSRTLNGLNVLDFDGSNDDMSMVAGPQPDSAQTIMIAVVDLDSPLKAEGQRLLNFQVGASSRWSLRLEDELLAQYTNAASFTGPEIAITSGARLISGYRDGTTVGVSVNGGVPVTDTSGGNATVDTWKVGSYDSANDFLDGGFAEVVVLKSYTLETLQKLEGYLAWKWGIQTSLPLDHPYRFNGTLFGYALTYWTPADITTEAWYDAVDSSTITESGGEVSQWDDKSGNGNHMEQGTGSKQPLTNSTNINGLNTISFDKTSSQLMETSSNPFGGSVVDAHVFQVFKTASTLVTGTNFSLTGSSNGGNKWQALVWDDTNCYFDTGGISPPNRLQTNSWATTSEEIMGSFYGSDTEEVQEIWKNGTLSASDATGHTVSTVGNMQIAVQGTINHQTFELAEMVVVNGTMTTSDRQKMEGYLAWKWGLVTKLPSDHPYRFDGTLFGYEKFWSPEEIVTEAWYDASDASTITEAGGSVSQIDDKSGNNVHAVQAVGGDQPLIVAGAMNGLDALHFVGRNNHMDGNSLIDFDWVITVIHYLATPAFSQALGSQTLPRVGYTIQYRGDINIDRWNSSLYTNGNPLSTVGATPITVGPTIVGRDLQGLSNFALQLGGDRGLPNRGWDGYIGEVIYGNQTLDTATRQLLEGYLAWKWGTQTSLPVGHPYKTDGSLFGY